MHTFTSRARKPGKLARLFGLLGASAALAFGTLEGFAIVVAEGGAEAQLGEVVDLLPVERQVLAVEQVVAAFDHRFADEEVLVALGAA